MVTYRKLHKLTSDYIRRQLAHKDCGGYRVFPWYPETLYYIVFIDCVDYDGSSVPFERRFNETNYYHLICREHEENPY